MAERSPKQMAASKETSEDMMGATTSAKQDITEKLKDEVMYAQKQLQAAQARHKRHFDARLGPTNDKVSPGDFVYVVNPLVDHPHKLAPVANGPFPVVAINPQTGTIQRPDSSLEIVSRSKVVKTAISRPDLIPKPPRTIDDHSHILNLPTFRHSRAPTSHGSTLEGGVRTARLPIPTTRPRRCMMQNTIGL